jgi:hypothetical protein
MYLVLAELAGFVFVDPPLPRGRRLTPAGCGLLHRCPTLCEHRGRAAADESDRDRQW